MKRLWTVYQFELLSYIKNKSFMISTIVLAVALGIATFLPRFFDMSQILGIEKTAKESSQSAETDEKDAEKLGLVDRKGYIKEKGFLQDAFSDAEFLYFNSEEELKKAVEKKKVDAGFLVENDTKYRYYVLNRDMSDMHQEVFDNILTTVHKQRYCEEHGLDYASFMEEYESPVYCKEKVLGKDAADNFWYCYALVIVIFIVIIMYGVMIATSVTTEKSNRSIEVLVTSIDSKYLLFGKVFAGATAVVVQLGLVLTTVLVGYSLNHTYWGDKLDMLLDIPTPVLGAFAVFGIGGFLFYAFLYGAMGALVSKTEDINKTAGSLQMLIMIVYFAVLFQLDHPDGMIMKICSFLPFSSYSAMFVRIGMGSVQTWEIVLSAVILFASIFGAGWLAAKLYRMGTLRYGNPIKLSNALKDIRHAQ